MKPRIWSIRAYAGWSWAVAFDRPSSRRLPFILVPHPSWGVFLYDTWNEAMETVIWAYESAGIYI